ncbi:hypothetical protein [Corynebacterium senegalense]|uniref:hypothetical protein n=1 Tax=Corynebacterium senegalense TaxID=2080750 RepID=UPI0011C08397|nr:hypothetical protein [Corynebacterium senegalense]
MERFIELQSPFPSRMTTFRKAAILTALTFEQEVLARKLLGAVHAFNNGTEADINEGLLPFPEITITLFNEYTAEGSLDSSRAKYLLNTFTPGGDSAAQSLIEAWGATQSEIRRNDDDQQ